MSKKCDLQRFVDAQEPVIDNVLVELAHGRKKTHWMWFVFPQLVGLGKSDVARQYAISGLDEARAYLAHPLLGSRLETCCQLVLDTEGVTAESIFGAVDTLKLRSCMTLFGQLHYECIFDEVLTAFYGGLQDAATLELLAGTMQPQPG